MSSVTCTLGGQTLSTLLQGVPNVYRHQRKTLADASVQTNTPYGGVERYKGYGVPGSFDLRLKLQAAFGASVPEKLEILQSARESLAFDLAYVNCDSVTLIDRQTVVFIDEMIELLESDVLDASFFDMYLKESYRLMLSNCEAAGSDLGEWDNGEEGNGTVSVETSIFKEGAGCIKNVDAALAALSWLELDVDFHYLIDASPYKWVSTSEEDTTDFKIYIINNKGASFYYSQSEKKHTENLKQQAKEIHNDFIKIISEIEQKGFIYHIEYDEHGKTKYISRIRINVKENLE
ncbi:unnamed protein product [marine sediment metagenome]|uniref:Uncharacterized protein n=1 Tax=marine sediment metagenome TaxID=412755 RepID=X1AJX9_9ZZZZ